MATNREIIIRNLEKDYVKNMIEKHKKVKEIWALEAQNEQIKLKLKSYGKSIAVHSRMDAEQPEDE